MKNSQLSHIKQNSDNFIQRKCSQHNLNKFEWICTSPLCLQNISSCLLCDLCYVNHKIKHDSDVTYFSFTKVFSTKSLTKIEELERSNSKSFQQTQDNFETLLEELYLKILDQITRYVSEIKYRFKQTYHIKNLSQNFLKLEEILLKEYGSFFMKDEKLISEIEIKNYLEFYFTFQNIFNQEKNKNKLLQSDFTKKTQKIIKLLTKKSKDIEDILKSDDSSNSIIKKEWFNIRQITKN